MSEPWCPNQYVCPKSGETECLCHGGFDNCCDHLDCPGNVRFNTRWSRLLLRLGLR